MSLAVLRITDGTTTVDLLSEGLSTGFKLVDWEPSIQDWKNGGIYQDSPLADLRQPVDVRLNTALETMLITLSEGTQDTIAETWQQLRLLLNKAVQYWVDDYRTEPVWIEARSGCETNSRYAIVYNWRTPADANPYAPPFTGTPPIAADRQLIIERGPWLETPPGVGVCLPVESGTPALVGSPSCEAIIPIANKHNRAAITHVFRYDASAGTYSANLVGAATPFGLLPNPLGANDAIYFGCATSLADSGPFLSVVFDLIRGSGYTWIWQYWDSTGAWREPMMRTDGTNGLTNNGVRAYCFIPYPDSRAWVTTTINGVTGYWLRLVVTSMSASPVIPQQQNRAIYTATTPYVDIAADDLPGEIPTLLRALLYHHSNFDIRRLFMGARSLSRGVDFSAYWNFADEQQPSGVTCAPQYPAYFDNCDDSPTGRVIIYAPGSPQPLSPVAKFRISSAVSDQYAGRYRVFIRWCEMYISSATPTVSIQAVTSVAGYNNWASAVRRLSYVGAESTPALTEMGFVTIPPHTDPFYIYVYAGAAISTSTAKFFDLILLPVDEYSVQINCPGNNSTLVTTYHDIDSINTPKDQLSTILRNNADDSIHSIFIPIGQQPLQLYPKQATRLWWLTQNWVRSDDNPTAHASNLMFARFERQARYYSLRGGK